MTALDLHWIRAQFPALSQTIDGRRVVFFDGPGGTQVPQRVIDAMANYFVHANANTHGAFATSQRTDAIIGAAHAALADMLNCAPDEVVFGPNMTTLTFALSHALAREWRAGDEVVLTRLDHDANVAPWQALEARGAVIRYVDFNPDDCTLDMDSMAQQINERTRLVAVGYASNAVGTINDVARVVELAHAVGALVFVDAVHYAPHGPLDVRAIDCDFLTCSPYKFFGPHLGALYGKREHMGRLRPYKVRPASNQLPDRWETGTKSHEGLAGLVAAIEYLADLGRQVATYQNIPAPNRRSALHSAMVAIRDYERALSEHLVPGLLEVPGLTFYGISDMSRFDRRTPTVAIRMARHTPRQLAVALAQRGFCTWDGNYYAISVAEGLGVEESGGMVRIGLVHYNTHAEIDALLTALREL